MTDTIFALSSGRLPSAIAVIRISGPAANQVCRKLAGDLPAERRASLRTLRSSEGDILDKAIIVRFPAPNTATGEDIVELHCHGGRAVVERIESELAGHAGLRRARPGEFTERAFSNGRMGLDEVEALADLLNAETELQRRFAQAALDGGSARPAVRWRQEVLRLSALIESAIDFDDEDDVDVSPKEVVNGMNSLRADLLAHLERPSTRRLREGVRVVLAGPPNSGKSSLFNAMLQDNAAITSATAGTTRDLIERSIAIEGVPFVLVDTAGLRQTTSDDIELEGIGRARRSIEDADLVLWLGAEGEGPEGALEIDTKIDCDAAPRKNDPWHSVSATTGEGVARLGQKLSDRARRLLPKPGEGVLNERQKALAAEAATHLEHPAADPLVLAEQLRYTRAAFDRILGNTATEEMLDALFGNFCIGK